MLKYPSEDTSAYYQARKRLPEKLLQQLFATVTQDLENKTTKEHLWCGCHVKVVDGSKFAMPQLWGWSSFMAKLQKWCEKNSTSTCWLTICSGL